MMSKIRNAAPLAGLALAAGILVPGGAQATNGFLSHCAGGQSCGMAGAGIAVAQDSTSAAVNPALMGRVGNDVSATIGWFHPVRFIDQTRSAARIQNNNAMGGNSLVDHFAEGSAGVNWQVAEDWTLGVSLYGSGGMHTKYTVPRTGTNAFGVATPNPGDSTVRYRLMNLAPTVAWTPTDWQSYGLNAILAWSDFKSDHAVNLANGQAGFNDGNLKTDNAFGVGFRLGGVWDLHDMLSVGATAASPVWFQDFDTYNDLFLGSIDTPWNAGIGVAIEPFDGTTLAIDGKWIAWSKVKALRELPQEGGFGWKTRPVIAVGLQQEDAFVDDLTLRAGWNYGPTPIRSDRVYANALFPAVTEHHVSVGLSYEFLDGWKLNSNFFYAPERILTEDGTGDGKSAQGLGTRIGMWQMGAQLGISVEF